jgi:uncharacterized protein (DUF433 family)
MLFTAELKDGFNRTSCTSCRTAPANERITKSSTSDGVVRAAFERYHSGMEPALVKHIESDPGVCGGKPCIVGTRIRVQDVYVWHELQGRAPDEIVADFPQLSLGDVHAALAYYWDHRAEIQRQMKESDDLVESLKQKYPSKLREKLAGKDAKRDPVSS